MALRTGFNHIHNLMLSGGSQDFRYNVSGSYNSTTGVMDESDKQTASLRINLTYGDMNKLFFQNIASLTQSDSNDVPYGSFLGLRVAQSLRSPPTTTTARSTASSRSIRPIRSTKSR